jgi:hypothetical protein
MRRKTASRGSGGSVVFEQLCSMRLLTDGRATKFFG